MSFKYLIEIPNYYNHLYKYDKEQLERKLKEDIKELDTKLEYAKKIPSFSWYIFSKGTECNSNFFEMLDNNYIDDIRNAVKEWLEYTDKILKEPIKCHKYHNFPYQIQFLINDVYDRVGKICRDTECYHRVEYLKQYIIFYEQTIEPCFELQEQITKRRTELKASFENNPLPKDDVDMRYFIYHMVDICEYFKKSHQEQYKQVKKIIQKAEAKETAKLFILRILKKCKKPNQLIK